MDASDVGRGGSASDSGSGGAGGTGGTPPRVDSMIPAANGQDGCSCRVGSGEAKSWPMAVFVVGWMLAKSRRSRSRARSQRVRQPRDELARFVARE